MNGRSPLVAAIVLLSGCSSTNTGTDARNVPEQACLDTCEALARAAARCGIDYERAHDRAVQDVANGDCKNVVAVRDEAALRARCLPALRAEPCADVIEGRHDPSCSSQLQRTLGFMPPLYHAD